MSVELSLEDRDARPPPVHNLFFALYPDAAAASCIAALARELRHRHALAGRSLKTENFHVSLFNLARYSGRQSDAIEAARDAAASVSFAAFDLIFDLAGSFASHASRAPLVLRGTEGMAATREFHGTLCAAMAKAGFGRARPFEPHVTMLYDRQSVPWRCIDLLGWRAAEFVLVRSHIGAGRHVPLGRWRLSGQGRPSETGRNGVFMCAAGFMRRAEAAVRA
jgi:RNA 2',3'-cyclic 3'-phosphodiesterase